MAEPSGVLEYYCLDGPLKNAILSGRSDDHRPFWFSPVRDGNRSYKLLRSHRFEHLPLDMQRSVTGCYVESQACRTDLWWMDWHVES